MALAEVSVSGAAAVDVTGEFAQPTTSEDIANPGTDVLLWVKIGATSTTVTVLRPGTFPAGDAVGDYVAVNAATDEEWIIPIGREYANPANDGDATVTFSQVNNVTALLLRA